MASIVLLMAACSTPNREKELQKIEEHEQMLSAIDISSDDNAAMELLALYRQFANDFPEDSLAPAFMARAADLCINLGKSDDAVNLLDSVITLYPGYEDIAGCYFLKGYAYENAEKYDEAKEQLEQAMAAEKTLAEARLVRPSWRAKDTNTKIF